MDYAPLFRKHLIAAVDSADLIRSTLGPGGFSKLVISPHGYSVLSNDAHQIVKEIDTGYPIVRLLPVVQALIRLSDQQFRARGDGTATTILLAAEFLKKALALKDMGLHPRMIIEGFDLAVNEAYRLLEGLAFEVEVDTASLKKMASLTLSGKVEAEHLPLIARLLTRLFMAVWPGGNIDEPSLEQDIALEKNLKVFTRPGELLKRSRFIDGLIVNRHRADRRMPRSISGARIALLDFDFLLPPIKEYPREIIIDYDPQRQVDWFDEFTESRIKGIIKELSRAGTTVIFTSYHLPELSNHHLAKQGILAVERTKKSDMEKLSRATGARIIKLPEEISAPSMGRARLVEERSLMDNRMTFVEGTPGRMATLFLRSPTRGGLDETERACRGALRALSAFTCHPRVLPGGGAVEVYLSRHLSSWALEFSGKLQLVVGAFACAIEVIPRTLISNAGADPLTFLSRLKHRQISSQSHSIGFNSLTHRLEDMSKKRVWDNLTVKKEALNLAVTFAREMIGVDTLFGTENIIHA